jgi:hypothetical protein
MRGVTILVMGVLPLVFASCGPQAPPGGQVERKEVYYVHPQRYPKTMNVKGFILFHLSKSSSYELEPRLRESNFSQLNRLQLNAVDESTGNFTFNAQQKSYLVLKPFRTERHGEYVLKLDYSVPEDVATKIYLQSENQEYFGHPLRVSYLAERGRNSLYVVLSEFENFNGKLRIDLGEKAGNYSIHDLEIREL